MAEKENRPIAAGVDRRLFALSAAVMLVGMALLGLIVFTPNATADVGAIIEDDTLITDVTATPDTLFDTSTQQIEIAYTLTDSNTTDQWIQNISVTIWDGVDGGVEIELYTWNATDYENDTATIDKTIDFNYDGNYEGSSMQVNVR